MYEPCSGLIAQISNQAVLKMSPTSSLKSSEAEFVEIIIVLCFQNHYTNDQYHELTDADNLTYEIRHENSIFFEVN